MGADCKSAGYAYVGSNPTRPIFPQVLLSSAVEHSLGKEVLSGSSPDEGIVGGTLETFNNIKKTPIGVFLILRTYSNCEFKKLISNQQPGYSNKQNSKFPINHNKKNESYCFCTKSKTKHIRSSVLSKGIVK